MNKKEARKSRATVLLRYTCMRFFVLVFCSDQTYMYKIIRLLSGLDFVFEFADLFKFFNFGWWLNWRKSQSPSAESTPCETLHLLSQRGVRLHVNWVNMERLSWCRVSLCFDSVDVESYSVLIQLMGSLTPHWLSVQKMYQAKTCINNQLWCL